MLIECAKVSMENPEISREDNLCNISLHHSLSFAAMMGNNSAESCLNSQSIANPDILANPGTIIHLSDERDISMLQSINSLFFFYI